MFYSENLPLKDLYIGLKLGNSRGTVFAPGCFFVGGVVLCLFGTRLQVCAGTFREWCRGTVAGQQEYWIPEGGYWILVLD